MKKGFELEQLAELKELRGSLKIFGLKNAKRCKTFKISGNISCLMLSWWGKVYGGKLPTGYELLEDTLEQKDTLEVLKPDSNLEKLHIWCYDGCGSPSWLANNSLEDLKFIRLHHCEAWKVLPNFGQLKCLEELHLSVLPEVEKIDPQYHGCHPQGGFPSLKFMTVSDMAKLKTWECAVFPSLEILTIKHCPELSNFTISVDGEGQKMFPRLCRFEIENCPKLHQVSSTAENFLQTGDHNRNYTSVRYKITGQMIVLRVYGLQMITALDQVFLFKNFRTIKSMEVIRNCDNLESFFSNDTCFQELTIVNCHKFLVSPQVEVNLLPQVAIQKLAISNCGISREGLSYLLKHIPILCELALEKCQNLLVSSEVNESSFHLHKCLQKLTITECRVHGDIITSLLKCLTSLHQLSIISCPSIEYVSITTGTDETNSSISQAAPLMCLQELNIRDCPKMVFINERGLSGLTALKKCAIQGCKRLFSSTNCFPENLEELSVRGDSPGINSSLKNLKNVHTLIVEKSNTTLLRLESLIALRNLELRDCSKLAVVRGSQSLHCLEVIIYHCPYLTTTRNAMWRDRITEEFSMPAGKLHIDDINFLTTHANSFSKSLHSLTIASYWKEWTEEQENALQHLTALKELTLYGCPFLCSLPGTYYRHPSLKKLIIVKCPWIKSLPQKGLPESLEKLLLGRDCSVELRSQCSELEEFECTDDPSHQDLLVFVKKSSSVSNEKGKKLATTG